MSEHVAPLIGLISCLVAVIAIAVSLIAVLVSLNRSLVFNNFLLAAAVLWAVHMPLDFGGRYWSGRRADARKITQSFMSRKS